MRERERGHRLAEAALGPEPGRRPEFPVVSAAPAASAEPPAGLARDVARLRRLPEGRAAAELRFLKERGWLPG